jgi:hypothetical protein
MGAVPIDPDDGVQAPHLGHFGPLEQARADQ